MRIVYCYNLHEVAAVANRNTETIVRMIKAQQYERGN